MTAGLVDELVDRGRFAIVPPGQARGVLSSLMAADDKVGLTPIKILQELGTRFSADAVFAGVLYRWREREGTDFAVNQPASVAFDLHLVRPRDGAVLWRGRFDKTQQSLSDNLLDMNEFIKAGGRWLTAEKLAKGGLKKQLESLFPSVASREGKSD
jgi:hypothetical protein